MCGGSGGRGEQTNSRGKKTDRSIGNSLSIVSDGDKGKTAVLKKTMPACLPRSWSGVLL